MALMATDRFSPLGNSTVAVIPPLDVLKPIIYFPLLLVDSCRFIATLVVRGIFPAPMHGFTREKYNTILHQNKEFVKVWITKKALNKALFHAYITKN